MLAEKEALTIVFEVKPDFQLGIKNPGIEINSLTKLSV